MQSDLVCASVCAMSDDRATTRRQHSDDKVRAFEWVHFHAKAFRQGKNSGRVKMISLTLIQYK